MKRSLCTNAFATRTLCATWALPARTATSRSSWRKCLEVPALRGMAVELEVWGTGMEPGRGGEPLGKMDPSVGGWHSLKLADTVHLGGDGVWVMAWVCLGLEQRAEGGSRVGCQ